MSISLETLKRLVEKETKIINLSVKSREQDVVYSRNMYFYLARKLTYNSLAVIGKTCNRDHATVLHSINRFNDIVLNPPIKDFYSDKYKNIYKNIIHLINEVDYESMDVEQTFNYYKNKYLVALSKLNKVESKLKEGNARRAKHPLDYLFEQYPTDHPDGEIRLKALIKGLNMKHGIDKCEVVTSY